MRIVHIIIGLNVGGAELMLKRLVTSHHHTPEYDHRVISLSDLGTVGGELLSMGIPVSALGMRGAPDVFRTFFRLRSQLIEDRPDIVQTWMYHADFLGGLAARSLGIRRILWGIRTTEIKLGGSRLTRIIRKACALLSPYVPSRIVCAANAARRVHEDVGYAASKMLVIPNGFAVEKLVATSEQVRTIHRQAGLAAEHRVVGSVGRFNAVKDQRNFVRAAGILAQRYKNLRFLMIGRDLDQGNVQLRHWIAETGRPECFVLLGERPDVSACLGTMDIFCLHSRTEGFPNVVGEAMAMARPCVVTDVGDAAFLVGNTGVVVPREDSLALAEGIERLLSLAPEDLMALGRSARQRILKNFTMDHARRQFEQLYQDLYADVRR